MAAAASEASGPREVTAGASFDAALAKHEMFAS
jgi:hypothetical protein